MNVASLELCKQLWDLSGWTGTDYVWRHHKPANIGKLIPRAEQEADDYRFRNSREAPRFHEENDLYSAYDLGYLLRKLEEANRTVDVRYHCPNQHLATDLKEWAYMYTASTAGMRQREYPYAGVPEDAAAKLAIELFKQGILERAA